MDEEEEKKDEVEKPVGGAGGEEGGEVEGALEGRWEGQRVPFVSHEGGTDWTFGVLDVQSVLVEEKGASKGPSENEAKRLVCFCM